MDIVPGDRRSLCHALMEPVALWVKDGGELSIVHRCTGCGTLKANRIAPDDNEKVLELLIRRIADNGPGAGPGNITHGEDIETI